MNIEIAPKETEIQADWYNAMMYCQFLEVDDKNDWRMPTLDELDYIYHSKNDFVGSYYWASTEFDDDDAWCQNMSYGNQNYGYKSYSTYMRAVRDIK